MGNPRPPLRTIIQGLIPSTIRSRLIWGIALVQLLLMTFFIFALVERQRDFLRQQSLEHTKSLTQTLAINSSSWVLANDVVGLTEILRSIRQHRGVRSAMVIDADGQVLTHTDASRIGQYLADGKSLSLLSAAPEVRTIHAEGDLLDIAAPILSSTGKIIGWARIAHGEEEITANLLGIARNGILYTLLAIVSGALLAVLLGTRLTSGLHRLLGVCKQIKDGRRDLRMEISGQDEVSLLGRGLNSMLDAIIANEKLILLNQQRLECLANIFQFQAANQQELLDHALEQALHLTDSTLGYIYFYDEAKQEFILNSWSKAAMQECAIIEPQTCYHLTDCGLWGDTVRQRQPILVNDYLAASPLKNGYPKGHVALRNYLTIPIFREEQIVAVVGVANKEEDYDQDDLSQLSLLMDAVWKLVERMRAEEELREHRAMLQQILNTLPQSIFWKDKELRYLGCNQVFAQAVGLDDPAHIRGKTDFDLPWPREEAEAYRADDREVLDGKRAKSHIVEPLQQADGSRLWIDTTKVPLQDQDSNVYGILGVYEDITARKQAADTVARSEEGLKEAQRIAHLGNWELDLATNRLRWSDEIYRIFEIDQQQFTASYEAFLEAIHPDDRAAVNRAYNDSLTNKAPYEIVHRLRMKDGRVKYVHERGETFYDAEGKALRSVGTVQDITEHKQAEQALTQAAREWSAAMDASDDLIYLLDLNRCIVRGNKTFYLATSTTPETAIGRHIVEIIHPHGEATPCPVCRAQEEKRDLQLVMEADVPDNPIGRPLEITVKIVRDLAEQPMSMLMTLHDLSTARKETEEKETLEQQLRQAQKMEAIGTLAGGIAHDFNNILSIIFGYTELAMMDTDRENCRSHLEEVTKGAHRAKELVQQILTFSRKMEQQKHPLQISLVVREALKMLRASIPTTIAIKHNILSDATVLADPTQIHQIVMNLCTNAYHAMRETGGILSVSLGEVELGDDFIKAGLNPGRYLKLEVSDTGCGIDPAFQEKIFEPYFTTKQVGDGTGMGLAVVHGIVKGHHGHITVDSVVGKGTSMQIYLPVTEQKSAELQPQAMPENLDGNGERILFVDDEEQIRGVAEFMLSTHGYQVTCAADGQEALTEFSKHPEHYQLLITDMTMPAMTGAELARQVLALNPQIPVILCTGQSELINREKAMAMGISDYLSKPFAMQTILGAIKSALKKS